MKPCACFPGALKPCRPHRPGLKLGPVAATRPAGAVDSARFGAVPDALIEGRVLLRYWPPPPARR